MESGNKLRVVGGAAQMFDDRCDALSDQFLFLLNDRIQDRHDKGGVACIGMRIEDISRVWAQGDLKERGRKLGTIECGARQGGQGGVKWIIRFVFDVLERCWTAPEMQ